MTNRYYNESFTAAIGQLAQSATFDAQFRAIQAGFDKIQLEYDILQGLTGITNLAGFPASFSGQAGKYAVVNTAESAIEFVSGGRLALKTIAGTSYTLATEVAALRAGDGGVGAVVSFVGGDTTIAATAMRSASCRVLPTLRRMPRSRLPPMPRRPRFARHWRLGRRRRTSGTASRSARCFSWRRSASPSPSAPWASSTWRTARW